MRSDTALYALAHLRRDVRIVCNYCAAAYLEPSDYLVARFGPMYPVSRICKDARCRKCGSRDMEARAA